MSNSESIRSEVEKQSRLEAQLKRVIAKEDLSANKAMIEVSARHLNLDYFDLAAALLFINNPLETLTSSENDKLSVEKQGAFDLLQAQMIRYRIEVGRIHRVTVHTIKQVLVNVTGVEQKRIGYIDIFDYYAVLSLPAGMPLDILQSLKEVEINGKPLDIKRLNGVGKKYRTEKSYRRGTRRHYLSKREPPSAV